MHYSTQRHIFQWQCAEAATDPDRLMELNGELKAVLAEKDELERRWLEISEALE